ncbi:uncharacterized protein VTP21DRAFT_3226 [Calcarisporiella thermophila]|uniref:uncharacterized protein n=1 Tax=Calcarisporiella thermophila TaxID=911321 RepID=UPI00374451D5
MDIVGPIHPIAFSGARYFLTCKFGRVTLTLQDDYTKFIWSIPVASKAQVQDVLKDFIARAEKEAGTEIKAFRSDRGTEFVNNAVAKMLQERGIQHQTTTSYTPESNGAAERANRSILEIVRTLLEQSQVPKELWTEAVRTATLVKNMWPSKPINGKSPYQLWYDKNPDIAQLRTFGCRAYAHIPKTQRSKLDRRAEAGVMVGYSYQSKAWRIFIPESRRIIESRDVRFIENEFPYQSQQSKSEPDLVTLSLSCESSKDVSGLEWANKPKPPEAEDKKKTSQPEESAENNMQLRRSTRQRKTPQNLGQSITNASDEPRTMREALQRSDADQWRKAAEHELQSLREHDAWDLVLLPPDKKAIITALSTLRCVDMLTKALSLTRIERYCAALGITPDREGVLENDQA